jgi:hypothetical protein
MKDHRCGWFLHPLDSHISPDPFPLHSLHPTRHQGTEEHPTALNIIVLDTQLQLQYASNLNTNQLQASKSPSGLAVACQKSHGFSAATHPFLRGGMACWLHEAIDRW